MKLLTHNFLQCHIKGVKNGYPLKIEAVKIDERDADFDPGQTVELQQPVTAAS
jgi:multifunctional methyltransferase subunit TRM112